MFFKFIVNGTLRTELDEESAQEKLAKFLDSVGVASYTLMMERCTPLQKDDEGEVFPSSEIEA